MCDLVGSDVGMLLYLGMVVGELLYGGPSLLTVVGHVYVAD